jgi:hypothetical protein
MSNYTTGRWYHVGGSDKRVAPYIRVEGDTLPGTPAIASVHYRGCASETAANARLLAAAPDLLDACEKALHFFDSGPMRVSVENSSLVGDLRAAIARAEDA